MNKCIICETEFEAPKSFPEKKTCSDECFRIHMRNLTSEHFLNNSYAKGRTPHNKGVPQQEWMSEESMEKCSKTQIQNQNCKSELSYIENRYLPHNTYNKGTVVRRQHIHRVGKNKGKVETEYYINIDWKGNRKPNNLYKRYVWEVYHQQDVPEGYVVYVIDGNKDNIVIENLELITRAELARRNKSGYSRK